MQSNISRKGYLGIKNSCGCTVFHAYFNEGLFSNMFKEENIAKEEVSVRVFKKQSRTQFHKTEPQWF